MYTVEWSKVAIEDLFVKVRTQRVADALLRVSKTALNRHHPPDGGVGPGRFFWRRGLTEEERTELTRGEQRGDESRDSGEQPWHFVLVYEEKRSVTLRKHYNVVMVLRLGEIVAGYFQ